MDKLGRITLLKEIRDLFMMEEGDTLTYYSENGRIYIKKDTTLYRDKYDFEAQMIEERVRTYEATMRMLNGSEFEDDCEIEVNEMSVDPEEEAERMEVYEKFKKDIAARERKKKSR